MRDAWEVLREAGVPSGAIRPAFRGPVDAASLSRAVRDVMSREAAIDPVDEECLAAWLAAFRDHWPDRFVAILGDGGRDALARVGGVARDPDRHLKLRRIAIANLAELV